jgi:TatD family-associated radical SAM protein
MSDISYIVGDSLYLNITNRCTNRCPFCIRYKSREFNQQYKLWLDKEPAVEEILVDIGNASKYKQIVFCGYGEPLVRLDVVKAVAKQLKSPVPGTQSLAPKIRIDTNGTANLFWGRNILPELKGLIDHVSISLNAPDAETYDKLCHSLYGKAAYPAVIEFIKEAKKYIPTVEVSVVDLPAVDKEQARAMAGALGVNFRVRPYYEETYAR